MDDNEIERTLQRYRPVDPPEDLLDRILTGDRSALAFPEPRTWPWAVAAAALLALIIGLHSGSANDPSVDATRREIADLSASLGGDALAQETATWLVRTERTQAAWVPQQ